MYLLVEIKNSLYIVKECDDNNCKVSHHLFMALGHDADRFNSNLIVSALNGK